MAKEDFMGVQLEANTFISWLTLLQEEAVFESRSPQGAASSAGGEGCACVQLCSSHPQVITMKVTKNIELYQCQHHRQPVRPVGCLKQVSSEQTLGSLKILI